VFFHVNAVVRNGVPVRAGARVTFELGPGRRGRLAAQSVMVLSE
jgi:cold shock CspA family protein